MTLIHGEPVGWYRRAGRGKPCVSWYHPRGGAKADKGARWLGVSGLGPRHWDLLLNWSWGAVGFVRDYDVGEICEGC